MSVAKKTPKFAQNSHTHSRTKSVKRPASSSHSYAFNDSFPYNCDHSNLFTNKINDLNREHRIPIR